MSNKEPKQVPTIVLAAPFSGGGKTTVTAGLIATLTQQGHRVHPFKVGPDYIDPSYHTLAAGHPCRNLDTWMISTDNVRESFSRNAQTADIAIVEGVMGLFDGASGGGLSGSTAEIALLLGAPIILVINARGMARSAAALVHGYATFEHTVKIAGVILNNVGSARHAELCTAAIHEKMPDMPVLGYLQKDKRLVLPERHLGLIPTAENGPWREVIDFAAAQIRQTIDLQRLMAIAATATPLPHPQRQPSQTQKTAPTVRLALADDAAFSFTYPENVELLEEAGAEIIRFSPLAGDRLPTNVDGVILVGGFPELYAEALSANQSLFDDLRQAHQQNIPIYGECGGLMVLTEGIRDLDGRFWPMANLLAGHCQMEERVTLGYRQLRTAAHGPILPAGTELRAHEFHYSSWSNRPDTPDPAYTVLPRRPQEKERSAGIRHGSIWASYMHLHLLTHPKIAPNFIAWCARQNKKRRKAEITQA